ncbi:FAD-dependent pyridine nucleotide-disulphide oxidoreductase [Gloeothece citriformis PCC 7424]|uniref:FAD-dependent pyridine nucleotide-disulphide oxidoreductase n=1 Tax=Gloeothece citriformis (strain PCC 7424) TaxID=65393 RepID=B7K6T8_GLOC7|nr:NAD(P)-binding domain-containing protein [Gloeothece citriformis]ACK72637.1 FAD-dependent pyridine nucleotide-disulphide oxidoreductase [Gloeothece citriformis PCC 7424]
MKNFSKDSFEYLIIGAGPAGLQLGYFLEKAGRDYLILEAGETPATAFQQYPRHRQLISINKVYTGYDDPEINLRWDWNSLLSDKEEMLFKNYSKSYFPSADSLVKYLEDFSVHFSLKIRYGIKVVKIIKDQQFLVIDRNGRVYSCQRLIIATGLSQPYIPPIPGIEYAENYSNVSINPDDFINQKVLIIGKGNSGFETANNLIETTSLIHIASPHSLSLAWKSRYVGHLRAVNNNILDTYQLKSQNVIIDALVLNIERLQNGQLKVTFHYSHADDEIEDIVYDRIILCTGFQFDSSIFDESCQPKLAYNNRFPALTSEWESVNIQDLYFIGVLMHMRDYKKKQSGFIHGFRYNIRTLHHLLEQKYHNCPFPSITLLASPEPLTEAILNRVNTNSGLWQQTGFLADVIIISPSGKEAQYYQELPVDYLLESPLGQSDHYYTITMEFGLDIIEQAADPFAMDRIHKDDTEHSSKSFGIHPIIRRYCHGTLMTEHHVIEDIASEWKEDVHISPLVNFFNAQLQQVQKVLI